MKQLMLGNKAFARGLYEAGCSIVSSYPGTPSTEVTEEAAKYDEIYCEWAPNEKVAMEVAFGACLAGKRAFCGMKHVGLNVAADPLYTASYTGVNAGLVICVADDAGMHSSQNEQDSRHHAIASKVPLIEPSDSAEALKFAKLAFEVSEEYDTPVIMKMCTRVAHSQSIVETSDRVEPEMKPYTKNIGKYVMSRYKANQMASEGNADQIGLYALREFQNTYKDKSDNVLGEMLLYIFMEQVLGAPKIMSKIELNRLHGTISKSDGIHLYSGNFAGQPFNQIVYGASNMEEDLCVAADRAFSRILDIKNNRNNELRVVENTIYNNVFDKETTAYIKSLIIPEKGHKDSCDMAFGVFLGYSMDLSSADHLNDSYRYIADQDMQDKLYFCN